MSHVTGHVSHVMFQVSHVTCHVSRVTCLLFPVTCHLSPVAFHLSLTVFLSSRFARKDTTFSTGGLFSLGVTRTNTVPAGAGIIKQVFPSLTLTK